MPSSTAPVSVAPRCWIPPSPSTTESSCHPSLEAATKEVDEYFFQYWPFRSDKARAKYLASGFTRAACLYYPKALEGRIVVAGKLFSFCFLIDDIIDNMSYEDGAQFTASLMSILRHTLIPDKSEPVQYVLYEIWTEMCSQDKELAEATVEPMIELWFSQTDSQAELDAQTSLSAYLEYRERDFGAEWAFAILRFCNGLKIDTIELASTRLLERNAANHLGVVNDCLSWEKEVFASKTGHKEGAALCSAVQVISSQSGLTPEGSRRVLWTMVLEWEKRHKQLLKQRVADGCSAELKQYMELVGYTFSGNLSWCLWTQRYKVIVDSA